MTRNLALIGLLVGIAGCQNPMNLGYDYGRAFNGGFQTQADLSRPAVAAAQYRMSGVEGTMIRLRVYEQTTDAETSDSELTTQVE